MTGGARLKIARLLWGLAALIGTIWLGACQAEEPVKIGFLAGTSGRVADLGISGRDAAQMAIDHCNQNNGLAGRKVQLIVRDDQQDPETAQKAMRELIQEGVVAVIGPMTSDMAMAVLPISNEAQMPLISPTATTESLSGRDDYFIRVTSTTGTYAQKSAEYNIKSGNMKNVAVAYDLNNSSFTESWFEYFRKYFTAQGGRIALVVGFKADSGTTFTEIAGRLLAAQPDGILLIANSMDSAMLCQQIRKKDSEIKITLADWGATERLLELGGAAVEGVTAVQTFDRNDQSPSYQAFRKEFMERYHNEPGFPGVHTYDAVQVLLTALRDRRPGQTIKDFILSKSVFEGLQGENRFDRYGDLTNSQVSISIIKDHKFVYIE
jgi:branched-chain amino acid transport system substrate-binding protein